MRLIDADKIIYFKGIDIVAEDAYMAPKDVIDEMPTIEAEPVRHGKWERIEPDDHYDFRCECSNCKSYRIMTTDEKDEYNYCPKCGAKMNLDEVNNETN